MSRLTPIKAIRAKCLDCCCGQQAEVRNCPSEKCALYPYRMGHNPYIVRKKGEIPTDESETENSEDTEDFFTEDDEL